MTSPSTPILIHLTVKILSSSVKGNHSTRDDFAVLWLTTADWDKYTTSKNLKKTEPIELFLHKPADLQIELFDSSTFGSGTESMGVATLTLFENGVLSKDIKSLVSQKKTLTVTKGSKNVGDVDIDFLVHVVYQCSEAPSTSSVKIEYPFTNLVLEGGGVKGIAYGGVFEELQKRNILSKIDKVAGTSAGSIAGLCLALGANAERVRKALEEIDFASFADKPALTALHQGTVLAQTIRDLICALLTEKGVTKEKLGVDSLDQATFKHLKQLHDDPAFKGAFKLYYAVGTKIDFGDLLKKKINILDMEVFNFEKTPDMQLWLATRISMSVPGYFESLEYNGSHYVDGGVLYNYAINIFDPSPDVANEETLGLRVDTPSELSKFLDASQPDAKDVTNKFLKEYDEFRISELPSLIVDKITGDLSIYQTTKVDDGRSVYINSGSIGTTDFDIQKNQKDGLIVNGREWCLSFFSWWDAAYRKNPKPTGPLEIAGKVHTRK